MSKLNQTPYRHERGQLLRTMASTWLRAGGGLLLLLIGGAGGYLLRPGIDGSALHEQVGRAVTLPMVPPAAQTSTPSLKRYTNRTYGFSFDYPSWLRAYSLGRYVLVLVNPNATNEGLEYLVSVDLFRGDFNELFAAPDDSLMPRKHGSGPNVRKLTTRIIDGYPAVDYLYEAPELYEPTGAFPAGTVISKNGVTINILTNGKTIAQEYYDFLSSFKLQAGQ